MPSDLVQTYQLLIAARNAGRKFFAFYNCAYIRVSRKLVAELSYLIGGDNSGASQPHKHLQLIPVQEDGPPVEKLARQTTIEVLGMSSFLKFFHLQNSLRDLSERPFALQHLPYANHVRRFPQHLPSASVDEIEATLSRSFLSLLDLALSTFRRDPSHDDDDAAAAAANDSRVTSKLSYNVILTLEHMHVIPRKRETHTLSETGESLSINAMGFAGCLLVKSEREFEAVVKEGVGAILSDVGCHSIHDQQCEGACSL